jgi:hypothetical protein
LLRIADELAPLRLHNVLAKKNAPSAAKLLARG